MQQTTLFAPDIECDGCARAIHKAVGSLPGVRTVQVDIDTKQVTVHHDAPAAPVAALIDTLDKAGFSATVQAA